MRLRFRFSKLGKVRWTSHRDVARMWERAFRRVELPLAYSGGYSPRPKVSFGLALSTGYESIAEYLDAEIDAAGAPGVDLATLPGVLSRALPAGVDVLAAAVVDAGAASLQHEIASCRWEVTVDGDEELVRDAVERALAARNLVVSRVRKGQEVVDDVRPSILSLAVLGATNQGVAIEAELATQPRALRPSELLAALGPGVSERHVRRTHQWLSRDAERGGAREEPILLPPGALDRVGAPPALLGEPV